MPRALGAANQQGCSCGGGCPACKAGAAASAEESRAHGAMHRLTSVPQAVSALGLLLGDRRLPDGNVPRGLRQVLAPFTGPLPSDLSLRSGPDVDQALASRHARGLAVANEVWVGGSRLAPSAGGFASVFVHEAAHVASGGSRAAVPPRWDLDTPLDGGWYEQDLRRRADLEASETGAGRAATFDRLAAMTDAEVRQEALGIACRAQDRGDADLALAAARRLLEVWLAGSDQPVSFSPFGMTGDGVDALLQRAETSFGAAQWPLGGTYLSVAMVQLVRAAQAVVERRAPARGSGGPGAELASSLLLPMQRADEGDIRTRVERVRSMLETNGAAVLARGDAAEVAQFEAMAESVLRAEGRAGSPIVADLGTGGIVDAPARPRGGSRRSLATAATSAGGTPATAPASRAAEAIVNSTHAELEHGLVFLSTSAPRRYGNIESPRHGVAGTLAGARRLAAELFGQRSCVIAEDTLGRDASGGRQVRYLVLALTTRLNPPSTAPPEGQFVGVAGVDMLQPASSRYVYLAVTTGPWVFFPPALADRLRGVESSEAGVEAPQLSVEERRTAVFAPIDALIVAGRTQEAANQLTYVGASGFALVDTATKIRYVTTLLRAFTFEANERTVVEVFAALADEDELQNVLAGLQREGVLRQLRTDLESAFTTLLTTLGQKFGGTSLSAGEVRDLMREIGILRPLPGIEVRADLSVAFRPETLVEFRAAFEELFNTLVGAITGIVEIVADPAAFVRGIGQLLYFAVMADMAGKGNPQAIAYVAQIVGAIARQLGVMTQGLSVLQRNMPAGTEFVRDMQRSYEWRAIWEVVGLFVGVGEAVALVDAIRGGRAAAAMSEFVAAFRGARTLEEAGEGARIAGRVIEGSSEATRTAEAASGTARTTERLGVDAERATDQAAGVARDTERAASEGGIPPREPVPRGGGGGASEPLPDWQEEYIQDFLNDVQEAGALRVPREEAAERLRAQLRGRSEDEVVAAFHEWERPLDRLDVHRAETEGAAVPDPHAEDLTPIDRPRGGERPGVLSGDIGEGSEAAGAGARRLPPRYADHVSAATRDELRRIFSERGEDALRTFVDRLDLPADGLRQVEIPVAVGRSSTRRVDRLFREGESIVMREIKNYPVATLDGTPRILEELAKDEQLLGRYSYAVVDWHVTGNLDPDFLARLRALETRWGGRFRLMGPAIPPRP